MRLTRVDQPLPLLRYITLARDLVLELRYSLARCDRYRQFELRGAFDSAAVSVNVHITQRMIRDHHRSSKGRARYCTVDQVVM